MSIAVHFLKAIGRPTCTFRLSYINFWYFFFSLYFIYLYYLHENRPLQSHALIKTKTQVNVYLGAFIEGVATLLCRLASRAIGELGPKFSTIYESFIGTSLVVAGGNLDKIMYAFKCCLLIAISYISSFQLFGRLLQSGIGNIIEMGLSWSHKYRAYYCLLVGSVCRCSSIRAFIQSKSCAKVAARWSSSCIRQWQC